MGRPKKIKTPAEMERLWEEYKDYCDNQYSLTHEFSQRTSDFVSKELKKRISYTLEGFCVFLKIPRSSFYATYINGEHCEKFRDVVACIREECEADVRMKFELGEIPTNLSALWMSKYGYGTNINTKVDAGELVNEWIAGVESGGDKNESH